MDVFCGSDIVIPALREPVVAIGNFDGVHVGHQALLALALGRARALGGTAVVLTFEPHPAKVLAPHLAPPLITPLERKLALLEANGIDAAVVLPFTPELAARSADEFVEEVLRRTLGAREIVVGHDFTYGARRQGTTATLRVQAAARGMTVHVVPAVAQGGLVASSTKVRELALEGNVEGVRVLLGREFEAEGCVVKGAGRGRQLGFPTANVAVVGELLPKLGVYAGHVTRLDRGDRHGAAINLGTNPTFQAASNASLEAHLLDFDDDLYGERVRIEFHGRLRQERRFSTIDELREQIRTDVAAIRARLAADHECSR